MSTSNLPARASLEYLKKRAKERLRELRRTDPFKPTRYRCKFATLKE